MYSQSSVAGTSVTTGSLSNLMTYYWEVSATNANSTSAWSGIWSFTTIIAAPGSPTLSSPSIGAANQSVTPTLNWAAGSGGTPASYTVQVSTNSTFSSTVYSQSSVAGTSVTTGSLSNLTTYYWEVSATNANGTSAWSGIWSFTTIIAAPGSPTLSSPSTGATNQSVTPTLNWSAGSGGTPASYAVQVSTISTFSSTVYSQSGVTSGTSVTTGSLLNLTTYYWEVSAINANGTSMWSGTWSFTTIIAAPGLPTLSSPSTGATNQSVTPTLNWSAGSGGTPASYAVQVSTNSTFGSTVYSQSSVAGTSVTTGSLSNLTTYYWEVSATNANGTSAWSGIWSFTTIIAAPGSPTLSSPSTGATNQSVTPTLNWSAGSGGTPASYAVQVSTNSTFSSTVYSQGSVAGTSVTTGSLSNLTTYYWEVSATNVNGTSAWSGVWSFTTIIAAPGAPALSLPMTGAASQATTLTLSWGMSTGASIYEVEVSTALSFTSTVNDQAGLAVTSAAVSGLSNSMVYYWRANAANVGGTSGWSGIWSFTTIIAAPGSPVLASPSNNATGQQVSLVLTWSAGTGGAPVSYAVQVSTVSDFSSTVYKQAGLTGTSATVSGLANLVPYYWQVSATNANSTSAWSSIWNFTTNIAAPEIPTLSVPSNSATGQSLSFALSWAAGTGGSPSSYALQVSTASTFSNTVYSQGGLTGTSATMSGLVNLTTYYWEVNATNANGTSAWSGIWSFTTIIAAPGSPTLSSPSTGAANQSVTPTLNWSAGSGGAPASYAVQVSTIATFSSTVYSQSSVAGTSVTTSSLSNLTTYYWEVNATNANGTSAWSGIWSFTTIIAAPGSPTLSSPSTGAANQSVTPTLNWSAGSGGAPASYAVQVSTISTFSSTVYSQSSVAGTSVTTGSLSNLTTYYWEVSATNANSASAWSGIWSFTTIIAAPGLPTLSTPATGTSGQSVTPTLNWSAGGGGTPASYAVQVSTISTFSSTVYSQSGVTSGTSVTTGSLSNLTTYYWEVSATNANGTSVWSGIWSFTTIIAAPGSPTLSSPSTGADEPECNTNTELVCG